MSCIYLVNLGSKRTRLANRKLKLHEEERDVRDSENLRAVPGSNGALGESPKSGISKKNCGQDGLSMEGTFEDESACLFSLEVMTKRG